MSDPVTGETLILPTPVAVHRHRDRWQSGTKFLSWLTACLLALSVLVALVSVTNERNDLREQLTAVQRSQVCRSAAAVNVNQALINEQIAISKHGVALGAFVSFISRHTSDEVNYRPTLTVLADNIEEIDGTLAQIGRDLQTAVDAQQTAVSKC